MKKAGALHRLFSLPAFIIGKPGKPFHGVSNGFINVGLILPGTQTFNFMQNGEIGFLINHQTRRNQPGNNHGDSIKPQHDRCDAQ